MKNKKAVLCFACLAFLSVLLLGYVLIFSMSRTSQKTEHLQAQLTEALDSYRLEHPLNLSLSSRYNQRNPFVSKPFYYCVADPSFRFTDIVYDEGSGRQQIWIYGGNDGTASWFRKHIFSDSSVDLVVLPEEEIQHIALSCSEEFEGEPLAQFWDSLHAYSSEHPEQVFITCENTILLVRPDSPVCDVVALKGFGPYMPEYDSQYVFISPYTLEAENWIKDTICSDSRISYHDEQHLWGPYLTVHSLDEEEPLETISYDSYPEKKGRLQISISDTALSAETIFLPVQLENAGEKTVSFEYSINLEILHDGVWQRVPRRSGDLEPAMFLPYPQDLNPGEIIYSIIDLSQYAVPVVGEYRIAVKLRETSAGQLIKYTSTSEYSISIDNPERVTSWFTAFMEESQKKESMLPLPDLNSLIYDGEEYIGPSGDYLGFASLPDGYTKEQAESDGCVIKDESKLYNRKKLDEFMESSAKGIPGKLRLITIYGPYPGNPESSQYTFDLIFDGSYYFYFCRETSEKSVYRYLNVFEGSFPNSPVKNRQYILTNEKGLTWERYSTIYFSSDSEDFVDAAQLAWEIIP
ncbi:immunoglobulin-like domain-containing protein [Anaerolentibacter hominis]|uniref:immunoglobulin-like domain-containing protein n=1 Tax=Anaerolentibacter hominis TaxID=3079009 RepID=UPI0031B80F51